MAGGLPHWCEVDETEQGEFAVGCRCGWWAGPFRQHHVAYGIARRHREDTQDENNSAPDARRYVEAR